MWRFDIFFLPHVSSTKILLKKNLRFQLFAISSLCRHANLIYFIDKYSFFFLLTKKSLSKLRTKKLLYLQTKYFHYEHNKKEAFPLYNEQRFSFFFFLTKPTTKFYFIVCRGISRSFPPPQNLPFVSFAHFKFIQFLFYRSKFTCENTATIT